MEERIYQAYLQWQTEAADAEESEARLREMCEALVAALDEDQLLQRYKREVKAKARRLFQRELTDTLAALRKQHINTCVQRFRVFLERGGEAFVKEHRAAPGKWNQEAQSLMMNVIKQEGIPGELMGALRRNGDLYSLLFEQVKNALRESYKNIARGYAIHDLRNESMISGTLAKALEKADRGFDYKSKFAAQALLDYIPEEYADLYPAARTTDRHFVLHIGPTNSGKTYAALQAMRKAKDGIYLAPLRLLAYEQYDSMNKDGIYCSLRTGEEWVDVPGATARSCTIEMLDERHFYDVVVIDEAQMVQDPMRGGYWTKAILGAWADEIHVCLAPEAEQIVIRMIEECRDTYEIVRHERFNELVPDQSRNVRFPRAVEPGDAYIVFSRSSAHACVAELQKNGINPSIIYGALPYDVRQNEARRFREGETSVVVATDAIGMGLNLPIRRVVFLETEKFDGVARRDLLPSEYKQIAGRAGRYGQYEQGMYVSPYHMSQVIQAVNEPTAPIEYAHLLFPDTLLGVDAKLSKILRLWDGMSSNEGYRKGNVEQEILLAELLEKHTGDKKLIYSLISMPFDAKHPQVFEIWQAISLQIIRHKRARLEMHIPDIEALKSKPEMKALEDSYRQYDLLYYFAERFDQELIPRLNEERKTVSALLMKLLADSKLPPKTCRKCHRPLAWNSPFALCQRCAGMR